MHSFSVCSPKKFSRALTSKRISTILCVPILSQTLILLVDFSHFARLLKNLQVPILNLKPIPFENVDFSHLLTPRSLPESFLSSFIMATLFQHFSHNFYHNGFTTYRTKMKFSPAAFLSMALASLPMARGTFIMLDMWCRLVVEHVSLT